MNQAESHPDVLCIGASLVDMSFRVHDNPLLHTSNPSDLHRSPGGVVRNIAHHLALLGCSVELLSVFGKDADGQWLSDQCRQAGIGLNYIAWTDEPTGIYSSIISPDGEMFIGVASSSSDRFLNIAFLSEYTGLVKNSRLVLADCNLASETLGWLMQCCEKSGVPLILETVSVSKTSRLNKALPGKVFLVKANMDELEVFGKESDSFYSTEEKITYLHLNGVQNVWITKGADGSIFSDGKNQWNIPVSQRVAKDVNGAGDAAIAGWIWAYLAKKDSITAVKYGHAAAAAIIASEGSTRNDLSPALLNSFLT